MLFHKIWQKEKQKLEQSLSECEESRDEIESQLQHKDNKIQILEDLIAQTASDNTELQNKIQQLTKNNKNNEFDQLILKVQRFRGAAVVTSVQDSNVIQKHQLTDFEKEAMSLSQHKTEAITPTSKVSKHTNFHTTP